MRTLLLRFAVPFVAILAAQQLFPDRFAVQGFGAAAIFALVLAVVNAVVRPVLELLAAPITCLTLGLFHFVINAITFGIAAWLVPGIAVGGFIGALIGAALVSAIGLLLSMFVRERA
ncbi:MAG TPA: phage holin family protein [Chloroflexota bacterium]|nr:phage holin family protein [Chloroflexota bacterium]